MSLATRSRTSFNGGNIIEVEPDRWVIYLGGRQVEVLGRRNDAIRAAEELWERIKHEYEDDWDEDEEEGES